MHLSEQGLPHLQLRGDAARDAHGGAALGAVLAEVGPAVFAVLDGGRRRRILEALAHPGFWLGQRRWLGRWRRLFWLCRIGIRLFPNARNRRLQCGITPQGAIRRNCLARVILVAGQVCMQPGSLAHHVVPDLRARASGVFPVLPGGVRKRELATGFERFGCTGHGIDRARDRIGHRLPALAIVAGLLRHRAHRELCDRVGLLPGFDRPFQQAQLALGGVLRGQGREGGEGNPTQGQGGQQGAQHRRHRGSEVNARYWHRCRQVKRDRVVIEHPTLVVLPIPIRSRFRYNLRHVAAYGDRRRRYRLRCPQRVRRDQQHRAVV